MTFLQNCYDILPEERFDIRYILVLTTKILVCLSKKGTKNSLSLLK